MLRLLKVAGESLSPEYQEGDYVVILKIPFFFNLYNKGDVIVFKHPSHGTLIKEVEHLTANGREIYVTGTQENSLDSRRFGPIQRDDITGKVIWHLKQR